MNIMTVISLQGIWTRLVRPVVQEINRLYEEPKL